MKDLESALIVPKTILHWAGRWPQEFPTIFTRIREVIFIVAEALYKFALMAELYLMFTGDFDFDSLFEVMAVLVTTTAHLVKMVLFKIYNKVWLDILNHLKTECFNNIPKEYISINEKHVKFSKNFGNLFQFGCCCSTTMYIIAPFFSDIDLPIRCSFITKEQIPYMYIIQSIGLAVCAMTHSSIDVLSTDLIGIIVGQMHVLIEKIRDYGTKEGKGKTNLGECVEHHIQIIRFVEKLENAISGIILTEYFKSALVVCFLGIQAVHIDPLSAPFARIAVYGLVMLGQLAIYCFFANEILVKSVEIGDACYHSLWYNATRKDKSTLILIMEISKRQLYLTAGKFSIVSLQSFTMIMKSSYTYFALMQTLYAKDSKKSSP